MSLRRKGVAAPVCSCFHGDFPDVEFFSSRCYIHVAEEDPEESMFDPTEAPSCVSSVM